MNIDNLLKSGMDVLVYTDKYTGEMEAWPSFLWWLHINNKRLKLSFRVKRKIKITQQ